jgi:hypothetical protein
MTVIDVGPAKLDLLRIRAGDRNAFNIKLTDSNGIVNLSDKTIEAQARLTPTEPDPPAVSAIINMTDPAQGEFELRWPGDAIRDVLGSADSWTGVWDLQLTETGQDPQTLVAGAFTIESDVTR